MRRRIETRKSRGGTIFLGLVLFFISALGAGRVFGQPVEKILPDPGFGDGWTMQGKPATYNEKNLYKYINGEAELFYPYGFKALGTAFYAKGGSPDVGLVADLYEMGSPLDAFGIYSRYRDPEAESIKVGSEGFISESQLMFYKDRYFGRLSPSGTATLARSVFLACATAMADKISGTSSPPGVLAVLRIPAVISGTETYIAQSVLGYAFFKKGLTADATLDNNRIRIFVVLDDSPDASSRTLSEYQSYLEKAGKEPRIVKDSMGLTLIALDPLYKGVMVRQVGRYVIGAAKLQDPVSAASIIEDLQTLIASP
jgi:hypothetical protein